jgi:hypothetical protein
MKRAMVSIVSTALLVAMAEGPALAAHHGQIHMTSTAAATRARPTAIAGRIVAVRRLSQVISVQTAAGEVREVKVPNTAAISGHGVSRFSSVHAGQSVHVMAVRNESQGLVAHSVSVP